MNDTINQEKSSAIVEVANCIINSARVEVELIKSIGAIQGSSFIELPAPKK
jgi:hypothetical protein